MNAIVRMENIQMLRKILKTLIPSKGDVFYDLFINGAKAVDDAADKLADIINTPDRSRCIDLSKDLKELKKVSVNNHAKVLQELNCQFITPIDRGDIHQISALQIKLVNKIIKVNKKLQIYGIDVQVDDCLINAVNTLQMITTCLMNIMCAMKNSNHNEIEMESNKISELDDKVSDDLVHAMKKIKDAQYDHLTIIKLKEIYKALESAIDTSETLCDTTMMVSVKAI